MYVELDTTAAAPLDTIIKKVFYYDNAKRNNIVDYVFYNAGAPYLRKSYFFFIGTDTLPFKRVDLTPSVPASSPDHINDTTFYFYDNAVLKTDSVKKPALSRAPRLGLCWLELAIVLEPTTC